MRSGLFDSEWYAAKYPDIAAKAHPLADYLQRGSAGGRDPHPLFDSDWYLAENPEVAAAGANPLLHYLREGAAEGRSPHPLFDAKWYLERNPDLRAGTNPLAHYLQRGAAEGRDPNPLFDSDWYLRRNPDIAAAEVNPLVHYVCWGAAEGRNPSALFDANYYMTQVPANERGTTPLTHFYTRGRARGLRINNAFDLARHAELRGSIVANCTNSRPTILMALHTAGGGVDRHVRDLIALCRGRANVLLLLPRSDAIVSCISPEGDRILDFLVETQWPVLLEFLRDCNVARIHVHHLLGSEHYLHRLVRELDVPFDFTVHDYYALAPQPHLVDRNGRFVGEDLARAERALLAARIAPVPVGSLAEWQNRNRWLVTEGRRIIVPSVDASRRFAANFPGLRPVLAAHLGGNPNLHVVPTEYRPGSRLRIGLLGEIGLHKGLGVLIDCARQVVLDRLPLEFVIIGEASPEWRPTLHQLGVKISGRYRASDLPRLVAEYTPHLLWFPAQCPETFSYTLSEALRLKLPLVVSDLGALPERVGGRAWTWVRPWNVPPQEWLAFFREIREHHFAVGAPPAPVGVPWTLTDRFYRDEYLGWVDRTEKQTASYVP